MKKCDLKDKLLVMLRVFYSHTPWVDFSPKGRNYASLNSLLTIRKVSTLCHSFDENQTCLFDHSNPFSFFFLTIQIFKFMLATQIINRTYFKDMCNSRGSTGFCNRLMEGGDFFSRKSFDLWESIFNCIHCVFMNLFW